MKNYETILFENFYNVYIDNRTVGYREMEERLERERKQRELEEIERQKQEEEK